MEKIISLLTNPTTYLLISLLILVICSGKKYINIFGIIQNYLNDFIDNNRKTIPIIYFFPLSISFATTFAKILDDKLLEIITVAISILMSLFFTYLSFFQELQKTNNEQKGNYNLKNQKKDYIKETKSVASYEILISILILILCFVYPISKGKIMSGVIYFLFYHLLINLLVLLKRYNNNL